MCLLADVRSHETANGFEWLNYADSEGMPTSEPISYEPSSKNFHYWACVNCGFQCDATYSFDKMRAHIGKRNPFLHPFAENLGSQHLKTAAKRQGQLPI